MARAGRLMYLARAGYAGNMTGTKNQCMYNTYIGQAALRLGHGWAGTLYGKGRQAHVSGQSWPCGHVMLACRAHLAVGGARSSVP